MRVASGPERFDYWVLDSFLMVLLMVLIAGQSTRVYEAWNTKITFSAPIVSAGNSHD